MDARHASLGRRTLEEIRQKRAAERLSKASSVTDLQSPPQGIKRTESENRLSEDVGALVSQIKDLERKNLELEEENKNLASKLQMREAENDSLQKHLNDLEHNSLPSLRKALRDAAMEKDVAVTAREDMSAQLRMIKKRLKEAEEEQYKTEEHAAALSAELNSLQQQATISPFSAIPSMGNSPDHLKALEKEIADLKSNLQQESALREKDRHRLVEEQARTSALVADNQVLQERIAGLSEKLSEASDSNANKGFSAQDKEKLEKQLHDMALMIERLESGRQKLLMEIDSQSSEIEKLFEENSNLSTSYNEAMQEAVQWENQVKECIQQNEELRNLLGKFRTEQANLFLSSGAFQSGHLEDGKDSGNKLIAKEHTAEILLLKGQLAKEQSRAEELSAEIMKLSAQLRHRTQAFNGLARLYKPVLRNIESGLIKMKQDGSVAVR
ncbi:hypothetical protein Scep_005468 [Stephania cephalantha]|uniref:Uncharacterized protein n=1 Tax=Stephania cephalantha TaxID=152367 RepID=A0AAP0KXH4_9MAGN